MKVIYIVIHLTQISFRLYNGCKTALTPHIIIVINKSELYSVIVKRIKLMAQYDLSVSRSCTATT